jgi:preprotein translocase subunit SecD
MVMLVPLFVLLLAGAPAASPRPGLWIGPIRACASTVAEAAVGREEHSGLPNLTIRFREGWADVLRRVTAARVGRPMAIRLDGRILSEPVVREPIAGGTITMVPIEADEAEAIREMALAAC